MKYAVTSADGRRPGRSHGVERERTSLHASTELEPGPGHADLSNRQPACLGERVQVPTLAMPHDLEQALGGLAWQALLTGHDPNPFARHDPNAFTERDPGSFVVHPLLGRVARRLAPTQIRPVPTPIRLAPTPIRAGPEYHRARRFCRSRRSR